jgi:enoyl-CoA hydratase
MKELGEVVDEVYANAMIKSVILTGAGQKAFVAGADITEFLGLNVLEGGILAKIGQDIFMKIENSPKPFVAAVNGFALGGGCELAMACHFRICSENARFGQPSEPRIDPGLRRNTKAHATGRKGKGHGVDDDGQHY